MKQSAFIRVALTVIGGIVCICLLCISGKGIMKEWRYDSQEAVLKYTEEMYMPGLAYLKEDPGPTAVQWIKKNAMSWLPLIQYVEQKQPYDSVMEDEETDFDYLISNFYIVDSTTMIGPEQLNVDDLLGRSMKIDQSTGGPKVLIFHTHSQETFVDSTPGDTNTSIVGVGEYLTKLLNEKGIETIHDTGVYDIINGQLDRSNAYENAEASIRPILEANPSVEVVIDLHRDGVAEDTHLVTEINGKPTAKIMYFNGLSRTRTNGDIAYLYNPYIQDNLAFSLQMELASESNYPGFARHIYLGGYRYNLHLVPKSLLVEAGAQTNTVEEMMNAMEVLADTLHHVLTE